MAKHEDGKGGRADETPAGARPVERQRIAKAMARAGLCSRRDAEAWVVAGRVSLNGTVLTSPAIDIGPRDAVLVDGEALPAAEKTRLFMFHKPRGLVTSDHDPEGRRTIFDHLADDWPEGPRVVTVGRLDMNTEGLLLLTNDGGLARVLELPQTGWMRRYRVRAKGVTDQGVLDGLRAGVSIAGMDYAGIEAVLDRAQGANCWLTMGLREGKNREVKRVLEHIGLEVNRLIRLSFGPFQLGDLPEGAVAEVRTRVLRDQLGEALAAQAGVDFWEPEEVPAPPRPAREIKDAPSRRVEGPPGRARPAPSRPKREGGDRRGRAVEGEAAPPAQRQRPTAGPRRHVSALRAAPPSDEGPRRRVERTSARDAHDRTVSVERVRSVREPEPPRGRPDRVRARGAASSERGAASGERGARRSEAGDDAPAPRRGDRASSPRGASPSPRAGSPAARGKRERVLRSGGGPATPPRRDPPPARARETRGRDARGRDTRGRDGPDEDRRPAKRERPPAAVGASARGAARREGAAEARERPARETRPRAGTGERAQRGGRDRDRRERGGPDRPRSGRGGGGAPREDSGSRASARNKADRSDVERSEAGRTRAPRVKAPRSEAPRNQAPRNQASSDGARRSGPTRDRPSGDRPARGPARGARPGGADRPPTGPGGKPAGRPKR